MGFIRQVVHIAFQAGGLGLLAFGFLDSSLLMLPLGNDLLLMALSAHHHERVPYYVVMATLGSVLGCATTVWISKKGEEQIRKRVASGRLNYIQKQVEKHAGWALGLAGIMPPPFPFTAFVAGAAAFDYPRKKLLAIVGTARFVRFVIEGVLAIIYGKWMLSFAKSDKLEHLVLVVVIVSVAGSAFSIYKWIAQSRSARSGRPKKQSGSLKRAAQH